MTPGARYYKDGPDSGEEFYDRILGVKFKESLAKQEILTIILDGTEGYATSFLDEAFTRLAKDFGAKVVLKNIKIVSIEEPDWANEIESYISSIK